MKKKIISRLSFITLGLLFVSSCAKYDNYDFLGIGDDVHTWREELACLLSDTIKVANDSRVTLYRTDNYSGMLDISSFFNDSILLPAYSLNYSKMYLVSLDCFMNDTTFIHFKYDFLYNLVDSLLSQPIDYIVKKLTWQYENRKFTTLALFNPYTGELEYDNLLFNKLTACIELDSKRKKFLTRFEEFGYETSGIESAEYRVNGMTISLVSIEWYAYGGYVNNNVNGETRREYFPEGFIDYVHENKFYYNINYPTDGIKFLTDFRDISDAHHNIAYMALWTGLEGREPTLSSNIFGLGYDQKRSLSDEYGSGYEVVRRYPN